MSRWWRARLDERPGRPGTQSPPGAADQPSSTTGPSRGPAGRPQRRGGHAVVVPITLARTANGRAFHRDVELGRADHGRTVQTRVGEEFIVRLPETWAGGYTWQFTDPVDEILAVVGSTFEGAAPSRPGTGGHLVMRLRGRRQGSATLRLVLGRLWGGEPIDAFEVTVRVVEQGDGPHGPPTDGDELTS